LLEGKYGNTFYLMLAAERENFKRGEDTGTYAFSFGNISNKNHTESKIAAFESGNRYRIVWELIGSYEVSGYIDGKTI